MAAVFRLENRDASTNFNFVDVDAKRRLGSHRVTPRDDRVTEVWRITKQVTTAAAVRTAIIKLEGLMEDMALWHEDLVESDSIWLRQGTDGETVKRALVYNYELVPVETGNVSSDLLNNLAYFDMAITRDRAWESVTASTANLAATIDTLGGEWDVSGSISGGRLDSRLEALRYIVQSGDGPYERAWIGIKPLRYGTTNFGTLFECEDSTMLEAGTTSVVDASASGGDIAETDFDTGAGTAMTFRFSYQFVVTGSGDEDQAGNYHILLRARVTNADTKAGIRLSTGFKSPTQADPHIKLATQYIDGDINYRLYPMGTVMLPPTGYRGVLQDLMGGDGPGAAAFWDNLRIHLEAERLEGTGDLRSDCFVLIPAEHSVFIDNMAVDATEFLDIFTNEDGTLEAYTETSSRAAFNSYPIISDTGIKPWGYPKEGGVIVAAAERDTVHTLGDLWGGAWIDVLYKRWLIYHD
jgi:hypothetical protein